MKNPRHEDLLRQGETLIESWGLQQNEPAARYAAWIGRDPAGDLAIAHRLGTVADEESTHLLRRIEEESSDKEVRKEARRSLYRLEQRGIHIPPPKPAPAPSLAAPIEGYLSPVDGQGDQLVWLVKPRTGGVAHFFALINDPEGLRHVGLSFITRKQLKSLQTDLAKQHELEFVQADWRYCDFLIDRAFRWARSHNARMSGDYVAERGQFLKEPPPEDMPPLILSQLDPDKVRADVNLLAHSDELLEEKELRTWRLSEEGSRPYLAELEGIRDSPLVLSEVQQGERLRICVERAVVEVFDGEQRDSYVRRLEQMAHFLMSSGREDRARQALAVSLALRESNRGGTGIPFCEALIRKSLTLWDSVAKQQERERQQGSLVVTPRQFAAEQQSRRR
jgi:hypothetical protein